jgi:hypothetical protein
MISNTGSTVILFGVLMVFLMVISKMECNIFPPDTVEKFLTLFFIIIQENA